MKTICIASRKGGAGKSTLSAHLSVLAQEGGARVRLIDTDSQGSLMSWWRKREAGTPQMIECRASDLAKVIAGARRDGVDCCIIDTPPHADASILDTMRVADLVLVPTQPLQFDLEAIAATLAIAKQAGKRPFVVLNRTQPSNGFGVSTTLRDARQIVEAMGAEVAQVTITQRIALSNALILGQTVGEFDSSGKAAKEIAALWREIQPHIQEPENHGKIKRSA